MATITNWTGNMLEVGPIYPFVGTEVVLWIVGVALWILWHVWQLRFESEALSDSDNRLKGEELRKAINGER